ncbi:hypothetical protein BGW38_010896 [Lunasporangiospora selenospora]|uniref:N-acetyltransferase domain-containing protein n=1 Tax=Lunasporangiospora selenospora TaxID=979761 RepID=A0A9P6KFE9_9FUNG|nr:hypothetical protein BGW38_010896 [Lunasporangiospora selenospora]
MAQPSTTEPYVQQPILTARLALDPPSANDDQVMGAMLSDIETMAYLRFMTKESTGGWTAQDLISRRETQTLAIAERRGSTFYIHDRSTGELAGVMGANVINQRDRNAIVGIILWKKYHSGGYGTEALYELMRGLFEDLKMHKITYETTELNIGMRKFLEDKCSNKLAYVRKDEIWNEPWNKFVDLWQYEIFEDDWPHIRAALLDSLKRGAEKNTTAST